MELDPLMGRSARRLVREGRAAGVKAAERAVDSCLAAEVRVARDAEERVVRKLVDLCKKQGVPVVYSESMKELGEFCGLRVGAAACAILRNATGMIT